MTILKNAGYPSFQESRQMQARKLQSISSFTNTREGFNKIIIENIREKAGTFPGNTQYRFLPHRRIIDSIFIIRQVMQKACQRGVKLLFNFVNSKSACGKI